MFTGSPFWPDLWEKDTIVSHTWFIDDSEPPGGYALTDTLVGGNLDGDFTIIGWYNNLLDADLPCILWDIGNLSIRIHSGASRILRIDTDNNINSYFIDWNGTSWGCFIIVRELTTWRIYEGSTLLGTFEETPSQDFGNAVNCISKPIDAYDLRIIPRATTAEDLAFYFDNVSNFQGDAVLPNF